MHFSLRFSFFEANIILLNALSLNKLARCLFPLRNLSPSRQQRLVVTMVTVIVSAIPTCWLSFLWSQDYLISDADDPNLEAFGICLTARRGSQPILRKINIALFLILNVLMCFTMIVTTTILLVYAVSMTNRPVNKKNVFRVIVMCTTFIITFLPTALYFLHRDLGFSFADIAWSIVYLSVWINPWIHFAMNKNFRQFTMNKLIYRRSRAVSQESTGQTPSTAANDNS